MTQTPLKVIFNPPDRLEGFPGETVKIHVIIINQDNQGAWIDVFIDQISQTLCQWCPVSRDRVALDPQQSCEVTFTFTIPVEALPGIYDYTLAVDAPEHYPETTPLHYPRQLCVLAQHRTVERLHEPAFSLQPATSPDLPLVVKSKQILQLDALIRNCSNRVDRFHLTCPDLDESWFTVKYPRNNLKGSGLVSDIDGLELNPGTEGKITIELQVPDNTPAGNYSPTVHLISANTPEQVLLDLVYLQVPDIYQLKVELETILSKVSHRPGQYQLQLTNQGNLLRELAVSAHTRDEKELCDYICDPSSVKLLMGRTAKVNLSVRPKYWWRRPLFGSGLDIPFQIELQDLQERQLPEKLPRGNLIWKARPWWLLLLVFLCTTGIVASAGFLIWVLFFKPPSPPELAEFTPVSSSLTEGERIRLNWTINHADQLKQLTLTSTKDKKATRSVQYKIQNGIPLELNQDCQIQNHALTCSNIPTEALLAGQYTFILRLESSSGYASPEKSLNVLIKPKPLPQVVSFSTNRSQLQKGDRPLLSWKIARFSQLTQLQIIGNANNDNVINPTTYVFNQVIPKNLTKQCSISQNDELTCTNVGIAPLTAPGKYNFQLKPFSNSQQQANPSKPIQFEVAAIAPQIATFTVNGQTPQTNPTLFLKKGQQIDIKWQLQGDDVTVTLDPFGNVSASGSKTLKAITSLSAISLSAINKQGQSVKQAFLIQVDTPPPPPTKTQTDNSVPPKPTPSTQSSSSGQHLLPLPQHSPLKWPLPPLKPRPSSIPPQPFPNSQNSSSGQRLLPLLKHSTLKWPLPPLQPTP